MGFIYTIINKINFKRYIGQTIEKNVQERWKGHLKKGSNCRYLKYALAKYGKDNFNFEVILSCDNDKLNQYEEYYMKFYNTLVPYGYNLREAGNHGHHNEETKQKIGQSVKSYYANLPENEKKIINDKQRGIKNHNFGKKMPEEQKLRMIKNMKSKKAVGCYNLNHELIRTYESASEAKRLNGYRSSANVSHCCLEHTKTAYGFIWKFVN